MFQSGSENNCLSLRVAILSVYSICCVNVLCAVKRIACLQEVLRLHTSGTTQRIGVITLVQAATLGEGV